MIPSNLDDSGSYDHCKIRIRNIQIGGVQFLCRQSVQETNGRQNIVGYDEHATIYHAFVDFPDKPVPAQRPDKLKS